MLTFGTLKRHSRMWEITASTVQSPQFASLVNESVDSLLMRGDWTSTIQPIMFVAKRGEFTVPPHVDHIRKMNIRGRETNINNVFYQFVDRNFYSSWTGHDFYGDVSNTRENRGGRMSNLDPVGYFPTYNDILCPSYLRVYPQSRNDIGKKITIYGFDINGSRMMSRQPSGILTDGCELILKVPFAQSSQVWRPGPIERIVKDETQDVVRLYSVDAATQTINVDLAVYLPYEISPSYQRYRLQAGRGGINEWGVPDCNQGDCNFPVMCLVKVKYVPVISDNDLVLIDNVEAIKLWCQSIKASEANDGEAVVELQARAIAALNRQLNNEVQDDGLTFQNRTFGDTRIGRRKIW